MAIKEAEPVVGPVDIYKDVKKLSNGTELQSPALPRRPAEAGLRVGSYPELIDADQRTPHDITHHARGDSLSKAPLAPGSSGSVGHST
jgi:hypothetical protein